MNLAAFSLGAIGLIAQVLLFREALVRAGGDELALGALLGSWLIAGAVGALLARFPRRASARATGLGVLLLASALVGGVLAWRGAAGLAGALPGERQGALLFLAQALLWNGPTAILAGWLFARLSRGEGSEGAPRLVSLEALGAALAGVLLALPPVLAWIPFGAALESRHGRYEVVPRGAERWLRHDGRDRWALDARIPRGGRRALDGLLLNTPAEPRVLLAADPDFLPAVLLHRPARVDLLLADPALERLLRAEAGEELARSLDDDRVHVELGGIRRILDGKLQFDAIWLGDADPDRADSAQAVTAEGFERIAAALPPGGVVGLRLGGVDGVRGSLGMQRASLLAAGLADAGLEPVLLADGTLLGGKRPAAWCLAPAELGARAATRGSPAPLGRDAAWIELFAPATLELWNRALRPGADVADPVTLLLTAGPVRPDGWPAFEEGARHTDRRPRARGLSARIGELHARGGRPELLARLVAVGVGGQGLAVLLYLLVLAGIASRRRPRGTGADALSLATTSLAATVGLLVVLDHYQARTGALYADLGWLGGAFLLGFSSGSCICGRLRRGVVELATIGGLCLVGLTILRPLPGAGAGVGAAAASLLLGGVAGAAVGAGARARGLSWAWALDLAAAAPGALLVGLVLLPAGGWAGCLAVAFGLELVALATRAAQMRGARGTSRGEVAIGSRDPEDL